MTIPSGSGTLPAYSPLLFQSQPSAPTFPAADTQPSPALADDVFEDVRQGKSIDAIAQDRGMTREQVINALGGGAAPEVTVTEPTSDNGDVRTTIVEDESGRTVTEYYDYHHGTHYTVVEEPDGETTTSPVRNEAEETYEETYDPETGVSTRTEVDDLGTGRTETTTTYDSNTTVVTTTERNGTSTTVVTGPDGSEVELAASQAAPGKPGNNGSDDAIAANVDSVMEDLEAGNDIEEIAQQRGLTAEQVIAELQAAGVTVSQQDTQVGEVIELADSTTDTTTTYSRDYEHGASGVTVTEADGTETSRWVDGNGKTTTSERNTETGEQTTTIVDPQNHTETTIVFDKDGRRTETVVEQLNDGEPIDYEVQPGDNLSDIAEAHGVTLQELAESNPELFDAQRDPDVIHSGETVVIEGGTRTTVEVTFNGYTVTENPDGTVTVANHEHDYEIEFGAGSLEADLAELLTEVNPSSSDPQEAREAETVLNTLDGIFASEAIQQEGAGLDLEPVEGLGEVSAAAREAIAEHGPGILAEPVMDQNGEVFDLYGERPEEAGADWVPLDWQGTVRWVHPDVAQALMADSETLATISELSAVVDLSNAQSDVHALDPNYVDAHAGAEDTLNEVLNAHGYTIDFKKPEGSLEDARQTLTGAQTVVDDAAEVRSTYEEASSALDAAIEANRELDPLAAAPDPNAPGATAEDSNIHTDVYQQEEYATSRAEHAEVEASFGEYNRLIAEGDLGSIELAITRNEQAGVDTQSPDHQTLLSLRDLAQSRVELGQTNADYLRAESDLRGFEAEQARMVREMFDEWLEDNSSGGDDMYARAYVTADGQAMIDVYYDHESYVEDYNVDRPQSHSTDGQSIRLSVFDGEYNVPSWINESLNDAWNEHVETGLAEGEEWGVHGQTFIAARENAAADLNELIASNADTALEGLNEDLSAARSQFETDLADYGPGTIELPDGAFPDGVEPVSVQWQGQTIMVSPDVKEQLEAGNLDAVIASGTPIQVQIDVTPDDGEHNPESRWVAPELALSTLDLAAVNAEIGNIEVFRDQLNGTAAGQRDTAENTQNYYMPNAVDDERLETDRQNVLNADFQSQFQTLYQNGFDGSFHVQEGDALEQTIQDSLGLDADNEDHADIVESVAEGIREFGGDTPEVSTIPIFYVDENGTSQTMLFGVRNGEGETVYVDITGKRFTDIEDFRHNNEQFSDNGQIVYANDLDMTPGEDGRIEIDAQQARVLSAWESTIDPIVGIGTGIATVLSFTPAAPIAAPIALAGGAYLGTRAAINQHEHISRGGDWNDTQSIMNLASIATTALPFGSGALRLGGLVRAGVPRGTAFMASIGGTRATSAYADDIARYMQSGATSNRIAYGIDATTVAAGVPLVGVSGYDLVVNGGEMNGLQFANAMINFGAGVFGTGMGVRGLSVRPGSAQTDSQGQNAQQGAPDGLVPDGVIPPGDTTGRPAITAGDRGRPMVVHEQDSDGVYRQTEEQVFHDADHAVIPGEVVHTDGTEHTADPAVIEAGGAPQGGMRQHPEGEALTHSATMDETGEPGRFVWDPQSGTFGPSLAPGTRRIELPAAPERPMLTASPATSHTYVSLQNLRHPNFHTAAEQFGAELYGGTPQVHFPVRADPTGPNPIHGAGGRYVDVAVADSETGRTLAVEIKAYGRWTTVEGEPVLETVPLSSEIQQQINKDIALRGSVPGYEPRWVFLGAPPSPALQQALDSAGIIANIWHPPGRGPETQTRLGNGIALPTPPARTPAYGNDNPRTFVVDANGVTTRRTFAADPNGEVSLTPPTGATIGLPERVTVGPDLATAADGSGPEVLRPVEHRDTTPAASTAPGETPFRRFDAENLRENTWQPSERDGGQGTPPTGDNRFWSWVQSHVPDFRGGMQVRIRANTDIVTEGAAQEAGVPTERPATDPEGPTTENFAIGNPTVASFGFAFSTKMNVGRIWKGRADTVSFDDSRLPGLRERVGREVTTSVRPHEYQNVTLSQLGLFPTSNQTVFQLKGTRLLDIGSEVLFGDAAGSPFFVMPRSAEVIGEAPDGSGWVVELSYSPMLSEGGLLSRLPAGRREFFGAGPDNAAGFVELSGPLVYDKIMEEFKLQVRPRLLAGNVPIIDQLIPRLGYERRPEVAFAATLPEGSIVSRQFFDQNQTLLTRTDLRVQFVVGELAYANRIASDPRLSDIRALANAGIINREAVASYVPGTRSGLRLSAIPGKTSEARFTSLTGQERWVWDSDQTNLDITFNDYYPLFGRSVENPDAWRARLGNSANFGLPQGAYVPSDGNVFRGIFGQDSSFATAATRHTVSLSTPYYTLGFPGVKALQLPFSISIEGRLQYKRDAPSTAPATARTNWTLRTATNSDGLPLELAVPGWVDAAISWAPDVSHVLVPKGAGESMTRFLTDLESSATPAQRAEIEAFRERILPQIKDQKFVPRETFGEIATFLDGQLRPASHLPPPEFSYLAGSELAAPLERWYTARGADIPRQGGTPFRRFDVENLHENTWRPSESVPRSNDSELSPGDIPGRSDDAGEPPPTTGRRSHPWIAPAIIATTTGGIAFYDAMAAEDDPPVESAPSILGLPDGQMEAPALPGEADASSFEPIGADPSQMMILPANGLPLPETPGVGSHRPGRFNPELEEQGFVAVEAGSKDNIVIVAKRNNADVSETIALNMGHIEDPSVIFAGDRIYLPQQLG